MLDMFSISFCTLFIRRNGYRLQRKNACEVSNFTAISTHSSVASASQVWWS